MQSLIHIVDVINGDKKKNVAIEAAVSSILNENKGLQEVARQQYTSRNY